MLFYVGIWITYKFQIKCQYENTREKYDPYVLCKVIVFELGRVSSYSKYAISFDMQVDIVCSSSLDILHFSFEIRYTT